MIKVFLYSNKNGDIYRFKVISHGIPIVCAGVSALVITCANFIQSRFELDVRQKYRDADYIDFEIGCIKDGVSHEGASLVIQNMVFGLMLIQDSYKNEIKIIEKGV